jgi:hypothetical protein
MVQLAFCGLLGLQQIISLSMSAGIYIYIYISMGSLSFDLKLGIWDPFDEITLLFPPPPTPKPKKSS